jgi:hypothetical protein
VEVGLDVDGDGASTHAEIEVDHVTGALHARVTEADGRQVEAYLGGAEQQALVSSPSLAVVLGVASSGLAHGASWVRVDRQQLDPFDLAMAPPADAPQAAATAAEVVDRGPAIEGGRQVHRYTLTAGPSVLAWLAAALFGTTAFDSLLGRQLTVDVVDGKLVSVDAPPDTSGGGALHVHATISTAAPAGGVVLPGADQLVDESDLP